MFNPKISALAVAVLIAGCGGGGELAPPVPVDSVELGTVPGGVIQSGQETTETAPSPIKGCSVVLYGDSILAGANPLGILAETPAQTIKRLRPKYQIDNRAKSGQSAMQAARQFPNENRTARVVVLEHGTNDMILGLPVQQSLASMAEYAKAEGRTVVVTGISSQAHARLGEYQAAVKAIAAGYVYADWPAVPGKTVDGTHPDQQMSIALSERLVAALDVAAPDCK